MKYSELINELDELSLETTAVAQLIGLISDYERGGMNLIHCYSEGICYVSRCADNNAKALENVVNRLYEKTREEATS